VLNTTHSSINYLIIMNKKLKGSTSDLIKCPYCHHRFFRTDEGKILKAEDFEEYNL